MSFNPENIHGDVLKDVVDRLFEEDFIEVELEKKQNMLATIENKDIRIRELEDANVAVVETKNAHIEELRSANKLKDEISSAEVKERERLHLKASFLRIERNIKLRKAVYLKYEGYAKYLCHAFDLFFLLFTVIVVAFQYDANTSEGAFQNLVLALASTASAIAYLLLFSKYIKKFISKKMFRNLIIKNVAATEWERKDSELEG